MLLARLALALVLASTLARGGEPPEPAVCDSFPLDRSIERADMRVHVLHERCTWADEDGQHTQRVARADVLRVDPGAPNGATHVVALVVASERTEHPDWSISVRHEVFFLAGDAANATIAYDAEHRGRLADCGATAEARTSFRVLRAASPLPRCLPHDGPLP